MKAKGFLFFLLLGIISGTMGQNTINLTFTGVENSTYVQLDSIKVINLSKLFFPDTVLYYPDTVLVLDYQVGIPETNIGNESFRVFQNYPNPMANQTSISLYVPKKDKVRIIVTDIMGRTIVQSIRVLDKGKHTFRFIPENGKLCFFSATWHGQQSSIKILQTNTFSANKASLEYTGYENLFPAIKASSGNQSIPFSLGDELLYVGYFDTLESGLMDEPLESKDYNFQFVSNVPCLGMPTVEYEGQVYTTIQILSQCWFKENLNVGTMIFGSEEMTNNGMIEKYCYDNEPDSCAKYGGLYQWDEIMHYTFDVGTQGICPPGCHIPTDLEWLILEGVVDSDYNVYDSVWWFIWGGAYRGFDAGSNLKSTSGWESNGNGSDSYGFTGLPGGSINYNNNFDSIGHDAYFWSSTINWDGGNDPAWFRNLYFDNDGIYRDTRSRTFGNSIRCLKD